MIRPEHWQRTYPTVEQARKHLVNDGLWLWQGYARGRVDVSTVHLAVAPDGVTLLADGEPASMMPPGKDTWGCQAFCPILWVRGANEGLPFSVEVTL